MLNYKLNEIFKEDSKKRKRIVTNEKGKKNGSTENSQLNFLIMGNGKEHIATNCLCLKGRKGS